MQQAYCFVCRKPTSSMCQRCKSVYYCSRQHQVLHWKHHQRYCGKLPSSFSTSTSSLDLESKTSAAVSMPRECFLAYYNDREHHQDKVQNMRIAVQLAQSVVRICKKLHTPTDVNASGTDANQLAKENLYHTGFHRASESNPPCQHSNGVTSQRNLDSALVKTGNTDGKLVLQCGSNKIWYRIQETPGAGLAFFATRHLDPGTLILREKPLLTFTEHSDFEHHVVSQFLALSETDKKVYLELFSPTDDLFTLQQWKQQRQIDDLQLRNVAQRARISEDLVYKIYGIATLNCFQVTSSSYEPQMADQDDRPRSFAVFATGSRINHSCKPNAFRTVIDGYLHVTTINSISEGQEIATIYFVPEFLFLPRDKRRESLSRSHCFLCACERCIAACDDTRSFLCCGKGVFYMPASLTSLFDLKGNLLADWNLPLKCSATCSRNFGAEEIERFVKLEHSSHHTCEQLKQTLKFRPETLRISEILDVLQKAKSEGMDDYHYIYMQTKQLLIDWCYNMGSFFYLALLLVERVNLFQESPAFYPMPLCFELENLAYALACMANSQNISMKHIDIILSHLDHQDSQYNELFSKESKDQNIGTLNVVWNVVKASLDAYDEARDLLMKFCLFSHNHKYIQQITQKIVKELSPG